MPEEQTDSNLNNNIEEDDPKKVSESSAELENKNSSKTQKDDSAVGTDDSQMDPLVDDIVRHEGDEIMETEDAKKLEAPKLAWYKKLFANKKVWIPLAVLIVLLIIAAVPFTRYKTLGLFLKQTYSIELTDSQTGQPVSAAQVTIAGTTAQTDNKGKVSIKARVGYTTLTVSKKYYKTLSQKATVGLRAGHTHNYKLQAVGRQVALTVINKISSAPIANATIVAAGTTAKTSSKGTANMVLPADKASVNASISASGYNNASVTVQVTAKKVAGDTFGLTPAGRVYFLSNASGTIDVVSTNLDGTDLQTVLAGTGDEDPNNTSLLASRDWKYLALNARRTANQSSNAIYLIDTATGRLTTMDSGAATFTPIGWSGHYFVYQVNYTNVPDWQSGATSLKSYNADTGKITTLFNASATGTSDADAQYQDVWTALLFNGNLVYTTTWYQYPGYSSVSGQQDTLVSIHPDGTGTQTLKSVDASSSYITDEEIAKPDTLYFAVSSDSSNANTYYEVNSNNGVSQSNTITSSTINQPYPTYLTSPSGTQTFWAESRDGENTLFVGDQNGDNGKQIANLSGYTPYGWYTNNYVLVQKNGSELYIMPAAGGQALKISDYYKPAQNTNSYSGSYGGQ